MARPAIVAGVALVLMETINDIGATEYLGVRTLTLSIFNTWLNRGSLPGAAQIARLARQYRRRLPDGTPDLSGIWQVPGDPRAPGGLFGLGESLNSKYFRDILSDELALDRDETAEAKKS